MKAENDSRLSNRISRRDLFRIAGGGAAAAVIAGTIGCGDGGEENTASIPSPTQTETPTPSPTVTRTPTETPIPTRTPTETPTPESKEISSYGLVPVLLVAESNPDRPGWTHYQIGFGYDNSSGSRDFTFGDLIREMSEIGERAMVRAGGETFEPHDLDDYAPPPQEADIPVVPRGFRVKGRSASGDLIPLSFETPSPLGSPLVSIAGEDLGTTDQIAAFIASGEFDNLPYTERPITDFEDIEGKTFDQSMIKMENSSAELDEKWIIRIGSFRTVSAQDGYNIIAAEISFENQDLSADAHLLHPLSFTSSTIPQDMQLPSIYGSDKIIYQGIDLSYISDSSDIFGYNRIPNTISLKLGPGQSTVGSFFIRVPSLLSEAKLYLPSTSAMYNLPVSEIFSRG